ncbi:hypothetical protein ABKV19_004701 [Rosa sericea]
MQYIKIQSTIHPCVVPRRLLAFKDLQVLRLKTLSFIFHELNCALVFSVSKCQELGETLKSQSVRFSFLVANWFKMPREKRSASHGLEKPSRNGAGGGRNTEKSRRVEIAPPPLSPPCCTFYGPNRPTKPLQT